jgi:hypothetical protein
MAAKTSAQGKNYKVGDSIKVKLNDGLPDSRLC